jgi:hypothetical protein
LFRQEARQTDQTGTQSATTTTTTASEPPGEGEVSTPDIDAIARDVYRILKRRLAREKERALGLS